jgi:hypothetical protein
VDGRQEARDCLLRACFAPASRLSSPPRPPTHATLRLAQSPNTRAGSPALAQTGPFVGRSAPSSAPGRPSRPNKYSVAVKRTALCMTSVRVSTWAKYAPNLFGFEGANERLTRGASHKKGSIWTQKSHDLPKRMKNAGMQVILSFVIIGARLCGIREGKYAVWQVCTAKDPWDRQLQREDGMAHTWISDSRCLQSFRLDAFPRRMRDPFALVAAASVLCESGQRMQISAGA